MKNSTDLARDIFDSPDYVRSRRAYNAQCAVEHMVYLLVSDAFLAKLLGHLGLSDAFIGIITSFTSLAFLFQLLSIIMMRRIKSVKHTVMFTDMISVIAFTCVYFLPFLPLSSGTASVLAALCVGTGFAAKTLCLSVYYRWANSYVHPSRRARFSAYKEMCSLACGIVLSLAVGYIVQYFESRGELTMGFLFIAVILTLLSASNFFLLYRIRDISEEETNAQHKSIGEVYSATLRNPGFLRVLFLECLTYASIYTTTGFLGTFKTEDLLFALGTVQIINVSGHLTRLFLSRAFGRFSDRTSFARGYELGLKIMLAGFLVLLCTSGSTRWLMIVHVILYNVAQAGIGANSYNMMYSYIPDEFFVQAQAIKCSISGTVGFLASAAGGILLSAVQENGNRFFGLPVYGQQILAAFSCLFALAAIIFDRTVLEKQAIMKQ